PVTGYVEGMYRDVAQVAGAVIVARHLPAVGIGVDDLRVARVGCDVAAFAPADLIPVLPADDALVVTAGDGDGAVVLLRAVDAIRPVVVHGDVIELRRRLIVLRSPALAAIDGDGRAAVIAVDQAPGIARVYPQRVMIAVRRRQQLEILAAVGGAKGARVEHVYGIECDRIGEDVRVVPGTLPEAVIGIDPHPAVATVVGTEHPALLRLDGGIDAVGVRAGHRHPDAAQRPVGQAVVLEELPGEAPVGRSIQPRARPAAGEAPRFAAHLPQRSEQRVGVARIQNDVDPAAVAVAEQHPLPALAAVPGAEDPALVVGPERVAERGDEHDIRVSRVDDDGADVPAVAQTQVLPGLAGIERLVYAVAIGDVAARAGLAGADIDDVVIRVGDRDRSYRGDLLLVEDRLPGAAGVGALPDPTGHRTEIPGRRIPRHAAHRHHPAAAKRTDLAPFHAAEELRIHLTGSQCRTRQQQQQHTQNASRSVEPATSHRPPNQHRATRERRLFHGTGQRVDEIVAARLTGADRPRPRA